ncbi:hypothetical protein E3N88_35561 [Mikania micrantha]|uniref:Uncharacterized protein n=1 Tax=Mikania micrantha TaxID=192012 RepID=A0A5N6M1S8_9ASTR|nr:hypothetical protein E3N88_35561 [Mikania micrantha]
MWQHRWFWALGRLRLDAGEEETSGDCRFHTTAGAVAAKTVTAPIDHIKLIMQTHGLRAGQESAKKTI